MSKNIRVLIAGGGTGGHLFPAVAIGDTLKKSGVDVLYIGSKYGIESRLLPSRGESPVLLNIRGFHRTFSIKNILDNLIFPIRVLLAYIKSRIIIKDFNPQVVVGTGGYSSGLPLLAAIHSGIKTLIQEQNSYPGFTTRKLASKVNKVCIGFKESASYIKKKRYLQEILFGRRL